MSLTSAKQNFAAYLERSIEKYPISRIPFSAKMGQDKRKELIFQQKLFLQIAQEYLATKPWVTYFATIKHFRVLDANEVGTATFNDLRDKEFATEVARVAENLRDSAANALDSDTIGHLSQLGNLQAISPLIPAARAALNEIASSKHHQAVLRAAGGQKPASGCTIIIAACILGGILLTILGDVASEAPAVSIVGMIIVFAAVGIAGGIAYFQFSHWQSVTQLLKRFQNDVVPVAKLLEIAPLSWLERPNEGISNLNELDARRKQLENTFLVLDA